MLLSLGMLSETAESINENDENARLNRSPRHCRKSPSPTRSLKPILDEEERVKQGIFVFNPFTLPRQGLGKRLLVTEEGDSFSDEDVVMANASKGSRSPKRKEKKRSRRRERSKESRAPRRAPSPNIHVPKVDPGPGTKLMEEHPTGPHPNPHRYQLFEALLKRKKVIPLPGRPGAPIDISYYPGCDLLTDEEFEVCCVLRLTPQQYFASRKTLVENHRNYGFYRKSAAQKMLKIDVNKTGKLYDFFQENGWLPRDEQDKHYQDPEDVSI